MIDPTRETIVHRAKLIGQNPDESGAGRDPRAGYPLGILYARGLLTHGDHAAGLRYAALHALVWGSKTPASHLANVVASISGPSSALDSAAKEKLALRIAGQFGEAIATLKALGTSRPLHVLENLVVYETPMRFMDTAQARRPSAWAADQRDLEALRQALAALAKLWGIERDAE